jgi:hypothetical protein
LSGDKSDDWCWYDCPSIEKGMNQVSRKAKAVRFSERDARFAAQV